MATRSEARQKTKVVGVRATPEEHAQLRARADAFGMSMGELCRQTLFGAKPKSRFDQEAIHELAANRADLGRVAGLLKGWLAGSFPNSPRPDVIQVRDLLKQIEASQATVVDSVKTIVNKIS